MPPEDGTANSKVTDALAFGAMLPELTTTNGLPVGTTFDVAPAALVSEVFAESSSSTR